MFSFVFVVNCKCLSWCTWLPQFPLWPRCSCCFYLRFPFSMTNHWVSPHLVFPLLFFLQPFPIFECCCLATGWFLSLLSTVLFLRLLISVLYACLFGRLRILVKSMRIVVDALCVCLRSCASVGCMFLPSPFQPLLRVINQKWTWTSQPSPK